MKMAAYGRPFSCPKQEQSARFSLYNLSKIHYNKDELCADNWRGNPTRYSRGDANMIKNAIAIMTSGGDSPGMNAAC